MSINRYPAGGGTSTIANASDFNGASATVGQIVSVAGISPTRFGLMNTAEITPAAIGAQPVDSDLTTIAGLAPADGDLLRRVSGAWAASTITALRTDLGLVGPAQVVPPAIAGSTPPPVLAWLSANRANFCRFQLTTPTTLRYLNWVVSVSSGNVQAGVISLSGASHLSYTRVMNSGIIACPAVGDIRTDLGATALPAGDYAAFLWADNTTFQTRMVNNSAVSFLRYAFNLSAVPGGVPSSGTLAAGGTQIAALTLEGDF